MYTPPAECHATSIRDIRQRRCRRHAASWTSTKSSAPSTSSRPMRANRGAPSRPAFRLARARSRCRTAREPSRCRANTHRRRRSRPSGRRLRDRRRGAPACIPAVAFRRAADIASGYRSPKRRPLRRRCGHDAPRRRSVAAIVGRPYQFRVRIGFGRAPVRTTSPLGSFKRPSSRRARSSRQSLRARSSTSADKVLVRAAFSFAFSAFCSADAVFAAATPGACRPAPVHNDLQRDQRDQEDQGGVA